MKIIRSFPKGKEISFLLPASKKAWTVQIAENVEKISLVGENQQTDLDKHLEDVPRFNSNLRHLDTACFNECSKVNHIDLSPQIKSINDKCFNNCSSIKTVSYDIYETCAANTTGKTPELDHIGNYAFRGCDDIRSLTLPESISNLSQIDLYAFSGSSLTGVTFLGITSSQLLGG